MVSMELGLLSLLYHGSLSTFSHIIEMDYFLVLLRYWIESLISQDVIFTTDRITSCTCEFLGVHLMLLVLSGPVCGVII